MRRIDGHPLWIGTARDARAIKEVLDAGIEAIVDLAMLCEPVKPTRELVYLRFPLPRQRLMVHEDHDCGCAHRV